MMQSEASRARLLDFTGARALSGSAPGRGGAWRRITETISDDAAFLAVSTQRLDVGAAHLALSAWAVVMARCTGATEAALGLASDAGNLIASTLDVNDTDDALALCAQARARFVDAPRPPASVDIDVLMLPAHAAAHPPSQGSPACLLSAIEHDPTPHLSLWFDETRIPADTAASLLQTVAMALRAMLDAPRCAIGQLPVIDPRPMRALNEVGSLEQWQYDGPGDVPTVFAARAAATPDAPALRFSLPGQTATQWTYRELDDASNRWAAQLEALGIAPGDTVGVALPRGPVAIALMLGALKRRAAYLPLDMGLPAQRLARMQTQANAVGIVVAPGLESSFPAGTRLLPIDPSTPDGLSAGALPTPAPVSARPTDAAYVMCTSGSTGQPKAMAITHQAIVRLVCSARFMQLSSSVAMLHAAPLGFDASTLEIWGPLLNGGTCVIYTEPLPTSHDLAQTIDRHGANAAWLTAALFNAIVDDDPAHLRGLSQILTGGEALSVAHVRKARQALPSATLINGYGPTESTTFTCTHPITEMPDATAVSIPIGRPVSATWLAVVNERLQPVPPGIVGELLIGGVGLTRGYLNNEAETRERFIDNQLGEGPPRLYRSGDRVRLTSAGVLEFVGRRDDQVKIRGYRVEPREIEAIIQADSEVRQCAIVTDHDPARGIRFFAWVSTQAGDDTDLAALRERLARHLPDYMMPSAFAVLPSLPVTRNGKLDRHALPAFPDSSRTGAARASAGPSEAIADATAATAGLANGGSARQAASVPPGDVRASAADLAPRIAAAMARTLDCDAFAPGDHFFDRGGNSLLAIRLLASLRSQEKIPCPVGTLYSHPTPLGLAMALARDAAGESRIDLPERNPAESLRGDDAIAIIGMAARYPGAPDLAGFAAMLTAGVDAIRRFSADEIDPSIPAAVRDDPAYVKARGVLDGVENFDAGFFGIGPREAELLDPQQRIFLQLCWSCLEHGGYVPDATSVPVGVFAGMYNASYLQNNLRAHPDKIAQLGEFLVMLGNEKDYIATRTAHRLNLTGPAISIHTACSTSLVAIIQACESLSAGQCDMALAGGVSVTSPPRSGHLYSEGAMLSPDGLTRTFDASAAGTVFSDGAGVVLLKRFADARRDGDTVYALIRGGAINNDGGGKASFMAPSAAGQARVIRQALARARVPAASIDYIETHGTATPAGDPIEIDALKLAFAGVAAPRPFCALGSVKSNIGHTVTAAGVAGVIRTVIALQQQRIPATLHFERLNPEISLQGSPFRIADEVIDWPVREDRPRRAGVSSFGVGGTNAHLILQEAPADVASTSMPGSGDGVGIAGARSPAAREAGPARTAAHILRLSAESATSLARSVAALAAHLDATDDTTTAIGDVAHTLRVARKPMRFRTCVLADDLAGAAARLRDAPATHDTGLTRGRQRPLVFVFPGQGSQYLRMGSGLARSDAVFARAYDEAIDAVAPHLDTDLRALLFTGDDDTRLAETRVLQPALFCIEYALTRRLLAAGLAPAAMIGHSIGEYAAATCAQVMRLDEAARLVAVRARLMQAQPAGRMLSVRLPAAALRALLPEGIDLAADNAPTASVCAGPAEAIDALAASLRAREIICRELRTSHAFHSAMMEPAVLAFRQAFAGIDLQAPTRPIFSTLTGEALTDQQACNPDYWATQIRRPVRFAPAVRAAMSALDDPIFIEIGPRASLSPLIRQIGAQDGARPLVVPILADAAALENEALAQAVGQLWCHGIDCDALLPTEGRRIALPTYSFDPHRHWLDAKPAEAARPTEQTMPAATMADAGQAAAAQAARDAAAAAAVTTAVLTNAAASASAPGAATGATLRDRLRTLLEDASGLPFDAGSDDVPFAELGLDSLMLTQIAMQLKRAFKVEVGFRQLMQEHDSIANLAAWLGSVVPASVASTDTRGVSQAGGGDVARPAAAGSTAPVAATPDAAEPGAAAALTGDGAPSTAPIPSARPFGAIARIQTSQTELTAAQREFIGQLIRRYEQRTRGSKQYAQHHRAHMADPRVVTGFKPATKEITYPLVIERSGGSRLWDVDGNEYVDVLNGFGMNLFGWQPAFVTTAVKAAIDSGYEIGPQHPLAGVVAQGICELTGADRAALCNTGSEAVMGATRIARTVTGRSKVVVFDGAYHGIFDEVIVRGTRDNRAMPAAPGIMPNTSVNVISLPYGTPESLAVIEAMGEDIAAVLVEPVQSRRPDFQPREFLHRLRAITAASGSVLVFDEVVTGFRSHPGGVQSLFDIRADLSTYGKVIGGGFPIGIIAGKRQYMDALDGGHWQFGDDSVPEVGVTYFAGTFVRHPLALAAASAVIAELKRQGPSLQADLTASTTAFAQEMNAFAQALGAPVEIRHFSSFWRIVFTAEHPMQELLFPLMRLAGVHVLDGFPCFFTTAHAQADFDKIKQAFCGAVRELRANGLLPREGSRPGVLFDASRPPVPGARLGRDRNGKPAWYVPNPKSPGKFLRIDEHV